MKTLRLASGDRLFELAVERHQDACDLVIREEGEGPRVFHASAHTLGSRIFIRDSAGNGCLYAGIRDRGGVWVAWRGNTVYLELAKGGSRGIGDHTRASEVAAPINGRVVEVRVTAGQRVARGQVLGLLEAMKTEVRLEAPRAAVITEVAIAPGDLVDLGQIAFRLDPNSSEELDEE
ncbi:MAG: biotin/lipoyl-binding protein [Candidatus Schekmanbacteria bacterium]|nr:biotin/lipoyl-binding protein [Candidatus Schekmanbacteria bacterium]